MMCFILFPILVTSTFAICLPDPPFLGPNGGYYQAGNPALYQPLYPGMNPYVNDLPFTPNIGLQQPELLNYLLSSGQTAGLGMPRRGFPMPQEGLYPGLLGEVENGQMPYSEGIQSKNEAAIVSEEEQQRIQKLFREPRRFQNLEKNEMYNNDNVNNKFAANANPESVNCKPQAPIYANNLYGTNGNLQALQQIYSPEYLQYLQQLYGYNFLNNQWTLNQHELNRVENSHRSNRWKQLQNVYSPSYIMYLQNLYGPDFLRYVNIEDQHRQLGLLGRLGNIGRGLWQTLLGPRYNVNGMNQHMNEYLDYLGTLNQYYPNQQFQNPSGYFQWVPYPWSYQQESHGLNTHTANGYNSKPVGETFVRYDADDNNGTETTIDDVHKSKTKTETTVIITESSLKDRQKEKELGNRENSGYEHNGNKNGDDEYDDDEYEEDEYFFDSRFNKDKHQKKDKVDGGKKNNAIDKEIHKPVEANDKTSGSTEVDITIAEENNKKVVVKDKLGETNPHPGAEYTSTEVHEIVQGDGAHRDGKNGNVSKETITINEGEDGNKDGGDISSRNSYSKSITKTVESVQSPPQQLSLTINIPATTVSRNVNTVNPGDEETLEEIYVESKNNEQRQGKKKNEHGKSGHGNGKLVGEHTSRRNSKLGVGEYDGNGKLESGEEYEITGNGGSGQGHSTVKYKVTHHAGSAQKGYYGEKEGSKYGGGILQDATEYSIFDKNVAGGGSDHGQSNVKITTYEEGESESGEQYGTTGNDGSGQHQSTFRYKVSHHGGPGRKRNHGMIRGKNGHEGTLIEEDESGYSMMEKNGSGGRLDHQLGNIRITSSQGDETENGDIYGINGDGGSRHGHRTVIHKVVHHGGYNQKGNHGAIRGNDHEGVIVGQDELGYSMMEQNGSGGGYGKMKVTKFDDNESELDNKVNVIRYGSENLQNRSGGHSKITGFGPENEQNQSEGSHNTFKVYRQGSEYKKDGLGNDNNKFRVVKYGSKEGEGFETNINDGLKYDESGVYSLENGSKHMHGNGQGHIQGRGQHGHGAHQYVHKGPHNRLIHGHGQSNLKNSNLNLTGDDEFSYEESFEKNYESPGYQYTATHTLPKLDMRFNAETDKAVGYNDPLLTNISTKEDELKHNSSKGNGLKQINDNVNYVEKEQNIPGMDQKLKDVSAISWTTSDSDKSSIHPDDNINFIKEDKHNEISKPDEKINTVVINEQLNGVGKTEDTIKDIVTSTIFETPTTLTDINKDESPVVVV